MTGQDPIVRWLLKGDAAIRWQVLRDLVGVSILPSGSPPPTPCCCSAVWVCLRDILRR
ncbi:hypothetical protein KAU04_03220 [bacterium]|nr:hypothetical protein [bacterium]